MDSNLQTIDDYLTEKVRVIQEIPKKSLVNACNLVIEAKTNGKKIFTLGNGGSANTASHLITDWNKFGSIREKNRFYGICLCDNIGLLTAHANDSDYSKIFLQQLKSVMDFGDLVIAISGSGNSPNVCEAIEFANQNGATTLGLCGFDGGKLKEISQFVVHVNSYDMQIVEDCHLMFGHLVMKVLSGTAVIYSE